ncbi:restriction endonuclease subunit S [Shewanella sp. JNE10-2]|uniref:restriction endonuclease subunit S n=1 Tax=unclassified Shewanella TaxID=196818 RepID=UPI002002AF43|nr:MULTISPECIES: restriction endonuclease subunit S [unclassified Shewanella]MCK7628751.1 restriction endonuclease subunit S [Shewanella sp. JNE9-1]MCK7644000.1 restriction endonuclease subunit S [Shewanella sp. JNE3-1]MCK7652054.1 restriction endonuclease subunit S [Shewanella sp. JNE4-1]UPO26080.1 restriction endonuclease subunit S [Shewanella sp. JNE10-2]UPO37066.1 restriction endonuclease subunit S [Shewanella sp. JNE7]
MSQKYHPYLEYKSSSISGVDRIPSHWQNVPLKYVATFNDEVLAETTDPEYTFEYIDIGSVSSSLGVTTTESMKFANCPSRARRLVRNGDVIVSTVRTYLEAIAPIGVELDGMVASTGFAVIRPKKIHSGFTKYSLRARHFIDEVVARSTGVSYPAINSSELVAINCIVPTIEEQRTIAAFLDYETARIDQLIAKQQRLIELLKEKRQAVISHAVTKGLNPNVPMKDSGVEWLGQVPEHWSVTKFGFISNVVRGGSPRPAGDPDLFDGDYSPWVTVAEITKDDEIYLVGTESFLTEKGSKQCRVFKRGTLLLSNSGATLGVPKILSIDANANDGVVGFEQLRVHSEYAYFYLSTLTENLRERTKQGSGQPNLNTDIVKSIVIPLPPTCEVEAILSEIKSTRAIFAALTNKADDAIRLMQERRTALISAAVTGKIDLRGWQPPVKDAAA